jgi:triphosphoribosyl-dephospho-CoA synthetase
MLNITKYDNAKVGCGYRYIITKGGTSYKACREDAGMEKYLRINGRGRMNPLLGKVEVIWRS